MNLKLKSTIAATLRIAAIAATLPLTQPASAQDAALEEIIVTAQKREESLQDLGISVTALGAERIKELGITSSIDIGRVAPGVVFSGSLPGGLFPVLSVRGISQSDFSPIQEAPNSVYFDEVYVSANGALGFSTFDLERIEVLRGPQGTLFGRNATGGLVNFVSAKPTDAFEGYAEAGFGSYSNYWLEGAVSGPITDRVRGRLSLRGEQADGWWENRLPGGNDSMETEAWGVRGQLEIDLTDNLLARVSLNYAKQPDHAVGTYKARNFYFDANGVPALQPADLDAWGTGPGNNLIGNRDPYADKQTGAFQDYGSFDSKSVSPTLFLQWTLPSMTLTSITNYTDFDAGYLEDTDGQPLDYAKGSQTQAVEQWSQELRANGAFGSNLWTAGLYFLDIQTQTRSALSFPVLAGSDFAFDVYQDAKQDTRSWAPYGQIEWGLTDQLRLTTGIRYTQDTKTFDSQVYFVELGNGYSGGTGSTVFPDPGLLVYDFREGTAGGLAKHDEGLWSGKIQLDYKLSPDALLYAGISRGVKGAGFNTNLGGGLTNEDTPFGSESVLTYEAGGKFEFLKNRVRLNGSAYYYDYDDYQGFAFEGTQGVVGNYKGEFYGVDLEFLARLPGDVLLSLGGSYSHTQLDDVPTAYTGVRDMRAVMAPEWIANGSVSKTLALGPGELLLLWSFDYLSDRYASVDNNPATYVDGSVIHNLRASYALGESGVEIAAFVNNVADTDRQLFVYDFIAAGGFTINSYDKPRWYGLSIRKKF